MKKIAKILFLCLMILIMYLPILILAVYSFTDSTNIGAIRGFSLENYKTLFTTPELRDMIIGTVLLALGTAIISTILGSLGAIGAFYSKKVVKTSIDAMNHIPVVNADVEAKRKMMNEAVKAETTRNFNDYMMECVKVVDNRGAGEL